MTVWILLALGIAALLGAILLFSQAK